MSTARGILRDNKITAEEPDEEDDDGKVKIDGQEYRFKPGAMDETDGG